MGARRKEQAHTRERVEECAGKSGGRLGSFVEGVCEVGSALVAYICCLTLMSDLGAEVGAVFLVHVRRRGRGLTDGAGFMARRYGWVHVYRRKGRNVGEIKFGECVTHRRWKGVRQCMALLQNQCGWVKKWARKVDAWECVV